MQVKKVLTKRLEWAGIPCVGGDDEVMSKKGRKTMVKVHADQLRIAEDGRAVIVHVSCDIQEMHPDHTNLHREEDFLIPLPYDWNGKALQPADVKDFGFENGFLGKNHQWNELEIAVPNSCVHDGRVKFDDDNDDGRYPDSETSGLVLNFSIPVLVDDSN